MSYTVLITASGTGSRLGKLTESTNKSVLIIHGKPAISYIIDLYPKDTQFIITVGYLADTVISAVRSYYPDRDITFVPVDNYEGEGSSLAYSLMKANEHLQKPFIFHACDTFTKVLPPLPTHNYSFGAKVLSADQYTTFSVSPESGKIEMFFSKGAKKFDFAHIGLVGIHDYGAFWEEIQNCIAENPTDTSLNDVVAIKRLIARGIEFCYYSTDDWLDSGNLNSLGQLIEKI